jgi:hypothetical protein
MGAAGIGVIDDIHIAGLHTAGREFFDDGLDGQDQGAEMDGDADGLRTRLAIGGE